MDVQVYVKGKVHIFVKKKKKNHSQMQSEKKEKSTNFQLKPLRVIERGGSQPNVAYSKDEKKNRSACSSTGIAKEFRPDKWNWTKSK